MSAHAVSLLDRRLLLVTGKGGVGKTTVAAAIAWFAAGTGRRVLAIELEPVGSLHASLVHPGATGHDVCLGYRPRELEPGLFAMAMDPEESLREYLRLHLHVPVLLGIGALSASFDFLANAAPGVREIVTIGKVVQEVRTRAYDLVVVDATASGHVIGQLQAPAAVNELVGAGMIRSQTDWMLEILSNPHDTGVVVVSTCEELPVNEAGELLTKLRYGARVDVAAVVANRVPPAVSQRLSRAPHGSTAAWARVREGVRIARDLRAEADRRLNELDAAVRVDAPGAQRGDVAESFRTEPGLATTRFVAAQLARELRW